MKQVYKCDFCYETHEKPERIQIHESNCSLNPIKRMCYSCEHHVGAGQWNDWYECEIGLSEFDGTNKGDCNGWKRRTGD